MNASESPALHDPPVPLRAKVVYLDQNKWIELAQAAKSPKDYPVGRGILEVLCAGVEAGSVRLPVGARQEMGVEP